MSTNTATRLRDVTLDRVGSARSDRLLLTSSDAARLRSALRRARLAPPSPEGGGAAALDAVARALETAILVPQDRIPPDVATMRSRILLKDLDSGARRSVVLSYPEEERAHHGHVSVLSPVGLALLGLSEGAVVAWPLPSGRTAVLRVDAVEYQPEAAEEFHL
jgi:regulator of nucleoside diphosphate kinase